MSEEKRITPSSGNSNIKGVNFKYTISSLKKKSLAPKGCKYLDLRVFYRSMTYRVVGLYKVTDLQEPERFFHCCHDAIRSILKANPFLVQALAYEGDFEEVDGE